MALVLQWRVSRSQTLALMLDRYATDEPSQVAFREEMLTLVERGEAAFDRNAFVPGHFTASAFILSPDETQLLLILHGKLKLWLQPGGHIDPEDHDVVAAARREAAEEVGLVDLELLSPGIFDVDVHAIPAIGTHAPHQHFDLRFLFRSRDLRVDAASDAKAARWVPLDGVADVQSDDSVMRAVHAIRRR